jgi:hypothetical protein
MGWRDVGDVVVLLCATIVAVLATIIMLVNT